MQEIKGEIKKIVEEFFKKATIEGEIDVKLKENLISARIKTEEPKILIGQNGQTLFGIQHLLRAILKRRISQDFYLDFDVNDYKKKKVEYLKEIAREAANEVAITKKEKELTPMPAYERRIIHLELAERGDVITESRGKDPERRVVIKPAIIFQE